MHHLLDTDTCVSITRRRPQETLQRLFEHAPGDVAISAVTAGELQYWVQKSRDRARNAEALRQFLSPLTAAPFDQSAAESYGRIRAALEGSGHLIGAMDMLIGAHAVALGAILVTQNTREFRRIEGLQLEDWLAADDSGA